MDAEDSALPPVKQLSESSDDESQLDEPGPLLRKQKRKRNGPSLKELLLDVKYAKDILHKRCRGSCKKNCLSQFLSHHIFEKFVDFRRQLHEMQKLDMDRLVP